MNDAGDDDSEQTESCYVVRRCTWCQDDPKTADNDQRLEDEARQMKILLEHLEAHCLLKYLESTL